MEAMTAPTPHPLLALLLLAAGAELLNAEAPAYQTWMTPAEQPTGLATGPGGKLWSADQNSGQIHRIDPASGQPDHRATIQLFGGEDLRGIAVGGGSLWVTVAGKQPDDSYDFTVWEIDLADLPADPTQHYFLAGNATQVAGGNSESLPNDLAYSDGSGEIWLAIGGEILGYDAHSGDTTHVLAPGFNPKGLAWHEERLWAVSDGKDRRLYEIDPDGGAPTRELPMYYGKWRGLAVANGGFWATDFELGTLTRYAYDPDELYSTKFVPETQIEVPGVIGYAVADDQAVLQDWFVPYLSSHPLPHPDGVVSYPHIKRVVLAQHGSGDDVDGAFRAALVSAREFDADHGTTVLGETLFISILLLNEEYLEGQAFSYDPSVNTLDKTEFPFINAATPPFLAYWSRTGGKGWGGRSYGSEGVSGFTAADMLLERAYQLCPNVEEFVVTGHSGGGQFTQRYCALSTFEDDVARPNGCRMRYVPVNPGNYMYLGEERFEPVPNLFGQACNDGDEAEPVVTDVTWIVPDIDLGIESDNYIRTLYKLCPDDVPEDARHAEIYSEYGLGISDFFHDDTPYRFQYAWKHLPDQVVDTDNPLITEVINSGVAQLIRFRYPQRCVFYCIGDADTDQPTCGADGNSVPAGTRSMLQGCNRYLRAHVFFAHFQREFPDSVTHSIYDVPGIGHDSRGMYGDPTVQECLYGDPCVRTASWLSRFAPATPPSLRQPGVDLDGDGKDNRLERALNTPPHIADGEGTTAAIESDSTGGRFLTLTYRQSLRATDLEFRPQAGDGLQRFTPVTTELRRVPLDADTDLVTVRDTVPIGTPGASGRRFMRLEVTPATVPSR